MQVLVRSSNFTIFSHTCTLKVHVVDSIEFDRHIFLRSPDIMLSDRSCIALLNLAYYLFKDFSRRNLKTEFIARIILNYWTFHLHKDIKRSPTIPLVCKALV